MVEIIPYLFDIFQSTRLFAVAVSLSRTTSWAGIIRRVFYKDRMGRVDYWVLIARREPVAAVLDSIVVTAIPFNYTILPANQNPRASVVVGRVISNH